MTTEPLHPRALIEVTVAAPADEVWRSLRDPERIAQWFGWDSDTLPDEIAFIFMNRAVADDAARVLRFGLGDWFEVHDHGATSVVRVVRAAPTAEHDWDDIFEDMTQGWIAFVQQLRLMLERHPHTPRRTIFLAGLPKGALAIPALGLPALPAGAAYAVTAAPGDALTGTVWHRNRHQLSLTVDSFGDGLLVVLDCAPDAAHPAGASSATITTYGLSDAELSALDARWRAWWGQHFAVAAPAG